MGLCKLLRERLESISALLSDADTKKLTISAVSNWFSKPEAVAHLANIFTDELAYEVTRRKVETRCKVQGLFPSKNSILYRFKVAREIKYINASFEKKFKYAQDIGLKPVEQLKSAVQHRQICSTPPFEDEARVVGRDKDISDLVQAKKS